MFKPGSVSEHLDPADVNRLIGQYKLDNEDVLYSFVENNPENLDIPTLMRITELCNAKREENAAFYTNKFIVNEIIGNLPSFSKDVVHILEPSLCFYSLNKIFPTVKLKE